MDGEDGRSRTELDTTPFETLKQKYELLTRASTDAFFEWDPDTDEITRSDEYLTQFGYDPSDVDAETDWWRERIHPDDRERVLAALQQAVEEPDVTYDETYRFRQKDGTYGYVRSRGYVIYDAVGEPERMVGAHIDMTDQKTYERALEEQNERLEEFASIVSHDLRNPLNIAEGYLDLARAECDSDHLDDVARAQDRMKVLIDDLLALAQHGNRVSDVEPVDLADLSDTCWRNVVTAGATLVTDTGRTIRADHTRVQQLLENLFRNAVEHGGDGVTVTVGDVDGDGFFIADDGPGIPKAERAQVFESGYSTEEGTGFGLAIVERIADAHDWEVRVTDSDDGGARFEITGVDVVE